MSAYLVSFACDRVCAVFVALCLLGGASAVAQSRADQRPATQLQPAAEHPSEQVPAITEEQLKQHLQGKTFYLRDGYLDNTLHFDQDGKLDGSSPKASFTLSLVEIERVHLQKHKVTLEGVRYGLHFLGASPAEDQTEAVDKVRLTSKKKPLRIVIDREVVVSPKKPRHGTHEKARAAQAESVAGTQPQTQSADKTEERAEVLARVPETENHAQKVTTSQQHANHALEQALDRILSPGIDGRMIATLPDYWQLFYKEVAEKTTFQPADSSVLRQNQVDTKARLLSAVEPGSNEFAQNNGVAGPALYHVVLGEDGKPQTVVIARPIGFGLDENAVDAIRKAKFEAARKDGKAVPVVLDVAVQFRIYSKRTADITHVTGDAVAAQNSKTPELPGPYTARTLTEHQQKLPQEDPQQQAEPNAPAAQSSQAPISGVEQAAPQPAPPKPSQEGQPGRQ